MKKTLFILTLLVGVLICAVGYADSQYRTSLGQKAPEIWLPTEKGSVPINNFNGDYLLLNFWTSTDGLARKAANDYTAWMRFTNPHGIRLALVNLDSNPVLAHAVAKGDNLIPSTVYYASGDTARAIIDSYGLKKGLGSVLIDPNGVIVAHNPSPEKLSRLVKVHNLTGGE